MQSSKFTNKEISISKLRLIIEESYHDEGMKWAIMMRKDIDGN